MARTDLGDASGKNTVLLTLALFAISSYPVQFLLRHLDDNRLTSWQWVFKEGRGLTVFAVLAAGVVLGFVLSGLKISIGRPALFVLFSSFGISLPFWGEPEVIVDTARYFTAAKHLEVYGPLYFVKEWGRGIGAWTDMPLLPFLYGMIFRYCGEVRSYIQIFTTLLFSLSCLLTYLIGKNLWDEERGFYGGLLLLGMPYLLTQTPLMLVDVPTMFFLMLAVYSFMLALKRGGCMIAMSAAAIALSFYSKYSAWMILSVLVVIFLIFALEEREPGGRRTLFFRAFLTVCAGGLLIGIIFWYKTDAFLSQMKLLAEYQKPGLRRWGESFLSTFFFQINPFISLAAVYSLIAAAKKKDKRYLIVAWVVLLVIFFQIRRIRYVVMVFPMLALMGSYGIHQIAERRARKFVLLCILVFSVSIALFAYLPFLKEISTVNLRDAGKYLDSLPGTKVKVYTTMADSTVANPAVAVPILDLFTAKDIVYVADTDISKMPREELEKSPLRFTWEFKNPRYYSNESAETHEDTVVVVSADPADPLPATVREAVDGCRLSRVFAKYEGLFQFRTSVRIYDCRTAAP